MVGTKIVVAGIATVMALRIVATVIRTIRIVRDIAAQVVHLVFRKAGQHTHISRAIFYLSFRAKREICFTPDKAKADFSPENAGFEMTGNDDRDGDSVGVYRAKNIDSIAR